jgi:hypothetical protein
MLQDQWNIYHRNTISTLANMFMACLDKLEGKTADYVDESTSKQYEFGMPPNFMIIKVFMQWLTNPN